MRTQAIVMTQAAFDKWLRGTGRATDRRARAVSGAAVFTNNGCGACHTFPAGATGKVGPDLDKLPSYAKTAGKPLEDYAVPPGCDTRWPVGSSPRRRWRSGQGRLGR